ncbi:diacylglycerol kinase [Sulfurivermis fontis]|jgi:diacylglycerol kinase (ATP)|uniref:diacylglycerol kinase n=1 Tax=Sulfurivermis fontis TaxID=1972068 RepID=UPI000FD89C26
MTEINKPGHRGLSHVVKAFGYSVQGLKAALQYEEAFRLELLALIVMLPAALWLGGNGIERALLVGSLLLVLIVELINSAIEAVVDRVGVEHHTLAGRAKDIGSAAVFMALMNVLVVWGFVLYDRFVA